MAEVGPERGGGVTISMVAVVVVVAIVVEAVS